MPEPTFKKTPLPPSTKKSAKSLSTQTSSSNDGFPRPEEADEGQLSLDVYETSTELIIVAPIAGVKMQDISVTVTEDILTIKGKRQLEFDTHQDGYLIQECFWGNFSRSIVLPSSVDTSKISASFKEGVLKISIPRTEKTKIKLIKIKAE